MKIGHWPSGFRCQ